MRMIDAEALDRSLADAQAKCKKNGGNFRFGVLSNVRANIADAPTVDAIPVDWIKGIRDILYRSSSHAAGDMLNRVIEMWRKEQEAQDGRV